MCRYQQRAHQEKLRSKFRRSYYGFLFISAVRVVSIATPYMKVQVVYISKSPAKFNRPQNSKLPANQVHLKSPHESVKYLM